MQYSYSVQIQTFSISDYASLDETRLAQNHGDTGSKVYKEQKSFDHDGHSLLYRLEVD